MTTLPATPTTILAAIDYSEASSLVVRHAIAAARRENAQEIHFLHVRADYWDEQTWLAHRAELEAWLTVKLQGPDGVPHTVKVVAHEASGNPAHVIVAMASDLLASLIVVGTHGRTGIQRLVLGSVAEAVVRNAGCTVQVVRPQMHEQRVPSIEPPCPRCVEARAQSQGQEMWCEQHSERHGRRHTYYDTRHETWVNHRISL